MVLELEGCWANCSSCQTLIRPPLYTTRNVEISWMKRCMRKQSSFIHGGLLRLFDVLVPFRKCLNTCHEMYCVGFSNSVEQRGIQGAPVLPPTFSFRKLSCSRKTIWKKKKKNTLEWPLHFLRSLRAIKGGSFPWRLDKTSGSLLWDVTMKGAILLPSLLLLLLTLLTGKWLTPSSQLSAVRQVEFCVNLSAVTNQNWSWC